jgi:hypothetical protein
MKCAGNADFPDICCPVLEPPHPGRQPKYAIVKKLTKFVD